MTDPADPSLVRLVDVREVEVVAAVPEAGFGGRLLHRHDSLVVAEEAERVVGGHERGIELRGIRGEEKPRVLRAVSLVTRAAVLLSDGRMLHGVLREKLLEVDEKSPLRVPRIVTGMAVHTLLVGRAHV